MSAGGWGAAGGNGKGLTLPLGQQAQVLFPALPQLFSLIFILFSLIFNTGFWSPFLSSSKGRDVKGQRWLEEREGNVELGRAHGVLPLLSFRPLAPAPLLFVL